VTSEEVLHSTRRDTLPDLGCYTVAGEEEDPTRGGRSDLRCILVGEFETPTCFLGRGGGSGGRNSFGSNGHTLLSQILHHGQRKKGGSEREGGMLTALKQPANTWETSELDANYSQLGGPKRRKEKAKGKKKGEDWGEGGSRIVTCFSS